MGEVGFFGVGVGFGLGRLVCFEVFLFFLVLDRL